MRRDSSGAIVLSERNLLALLSKVHDPASYKTLVAGDGGVNGVGSKLIVRCESDEVHYANREAPGEMSDVAESFIRQHAKESDDA